MAAGWDAAAAAAAAPGHLAVAARGRAPECAGGCGLQGSSGRGGSGTISTRRSAPRSGSSTWGRCSSRSAPLAAGAANWHAALPTHQRRCRAPAQAPSAPRGAPGQAQPPLGPLAAPGSAAAGCRPRCWGRRLQRGRRGTDPDDAVAPVGPANSRHRTFCPVLHRPPTQGVLESQQRLLRCGAVLLRSRRKASAAFRKHSARKLATP